MEANGARLVGTDPARLSSAVREVLTDAKLHSEMARAPNPFGDGCAGLRISRRLLADLGVAPDKILVRD